MPIKLTEAIRARVVADCSEQIKACLPALKEHADLIAEYTRRSLLPGQAQAMLEKLSNDPLPDPTPARLESHAAILASLTAIAKNEQVQYEAAREAGRVFLKSEAPLLALQRAAVASLDRQISEFAEREAAFFAEFGLAREGTGVTKVAEAIRESVQAHPLASMGVSQITGFPGRGYVPRHNFSGLEWLVQGRDEVDGTNT